ncbi:MAG: YdcF family protein [Betaproteobacteria bacterium]
MFVASKLLAFLIEPLFWVLLLLLAGVLLSWRRPRLGRTLSWMALLVLLLSSWTSGPQALLRALESRYAPPPELSLQNYVGIVVLGGALSNPELWEAHPQVGLNEQAERMTEAVALMRRHPQLQLLFTGGNASISGKGVSEAYRAKVFFDAMGVDPARVRYESVSRNSYENALLTASMPGVDKTQPWILLTSAFHLPRAMGVFTHAGWNVTAWPVDYRISAHDSWFEFSLHSGPALWELALHEWLGYAAYRAAGWL